MCPWMMKLEARKAKGFVFKSFRTARFIKLTFHVKNGLAFNTYITAGNFLQNILQRQSREQTSSTIKK